MSNLRHPSLYPISCATYPLVAFTQSHFAVKGPPGHVCDAYSAHIHRSGKKVGKGHTRKQSPHPSLHSHARERDGRVCCRDKLARARFPFFSPPSVQKVPDLDVVLLVLLAAPLDQAHATPKQLQWCAATKVLLVLRQGHREWRVSNEPRGQGVSQREAWQVRYHQQQSALVSPPRPWLFPFQTEARSPEHPSCPALHTLSAPCSSSTRTQPKWPPCFCTREREACIR